jgi:hypothetical protein
MLVSHVRRARPVLVIGIVALLALALAPPAQAVPAFDYKTPVFGLAARGDVLFVADSGQGVVRVGTEAARLAVPLPDVSDVAPFGRGRMWAVTSNRGNKALWLIVRRHAKYIANLGAFEKHVNPDDGAIDSNPFDVEALGHGKALVADAAANALLIVDRRGNVDWVATLPSEPVSTANAKQLVGCPNADPDNEEICGLPDTIPAEPVTTSVAVGPDGAYYVGELKGFPAPTGESQVWRIEPGTLHADCSTSDACSVVADGFTSIVDLHFGDDGTLYVVELDEGSWFALELGQPQGGTVDACDSTTWNCTETATGLQMPIAVATTAAGGLFALVGALDPTVTEIVDLNAAA